MNGNAIKEVVGVMCGKLRDGDVLTVTVAVTEGRGRLTVGNAPSYALDAVTDNGYYLKAEYGSVVVTAKEG